METEPTQQPSGSPAATAAHPRWVLLEDSCGKADAMGSISTADAMTLATARTSSDHLIGVSLRPAPPPAASSVIVQLPERVKNSMCKIVAAHGDSVLISVYFTEGYERNTTSDYFVYNAGADPRRPPSLSLLPPCYLPKPAQPELPQYGHLRDQGPVKYGLHREHTGLLCRGDDKLAVASLKVTAVSYGAYEPKDAELVLFRSGRWSFKRPAVIYHGSHVGLLPSSWEAKNVHPVGETQLCWVDMSHGLLFCKVFDESPVLRHVALPAEAEKLEPASGPEYPRAVCVTAAGTVKFVGLFPRCCCGGAGSTHCQRSRHAYTINTFTLKTDVMVWVKDSMVDATELWALKAYEGLPRLPPKPLLGMGDPHTICFVLCEWFYNENGDKAGWLILVDTRRKAILSVSRYPGDVRWLTVYGRLFATRVPCYLDDDSNPISGNGGSSLREGQMEMAPWSNDVVVDELQTSDAGSLAWSPPCKLSAEPSMQLSAVLAAFQEIPSYGLDRDDMLKAYSILSHRDGHNVDDVNGTGIDDGLALGDAEVDRRSSQCS